MMDKKPHIINFPKIGSSLLGYISVLESQKNIPFDIKRVFYTYYTPEEVIRGHHAHYNTEMLLIAVAGKIIVSTEMPDNSLSTFTLDKPDIGVYIPKFCWHTMQYSHNAVQMCIASTEFNEEDYIRDYEKFKKLIFHGT